MNVPTVLSNLPEPCRRRKSEYHYTIQIHLPVTSDISVYKAIFLKPERQLESVSMALKDFVFDARLAENSLAQWAAVGISVRGSAATPLATDLADKGLSPRLMYDAEKMSSVFSAYFCIENSTRELIRATCLSSRCRLVERCHADQNQVGRRQAEGKGGEAQIPDADVSRSDRLHSVRPFISDHNCDVGDFRICFQSKHG